MAFALVQAVPHVLRRREAVFQEPLEVHNTPIHLRLDPLMRKLVGEFHHAHEGQRGEEVGHWGEDQISNGGAS